MGERGTETSAFWGTGRHPSPPSCLGPGDAPQLQNRPPRSRQGGARPCPAGAAPSGPRVRLSCVLEAPRCFRTGAESCRTWISLTRNAVVFVSTSYSWASPRPVGKGLQVSSRTLGAQKPGCGWGCPARGR